MKYKHPNGKLYIVEPTNTHTVCSLCLLYNTTDCLESLGVSCANDIGNASYIQSELTFKNLYNNIRRKKDA